MYCVYRIIKSTFGFEKYLTELPVKNRILMTKFRCRNHRLPIEAGCRAQTQCDLRLCLHCNDIGDEYHYLLCCPLFREERKKIYKCQILEKTFHYLTGTIIQAKRL